MDFLSQAFAIALLVIGFGFVIFWHELGHFLSAKWVGIKVEQFAVGMGHALVSFRKGIGWKLGNTKAEYEKRVIAHLDAQHSEQVNLHEKIEYTDAQKSRAAEELGLGETEYRLAWIPIGGYVKMLGQDDMRPGADAEDPRAFNKKSIPKRMMVVSAGVIMNIILAAILFMVLFMMGFHAPAPVVGGVQPNSPAQRATGGNGEGVMPGDELVSFDGKPLHDFNNLALYTALSGADEDVELVVRRAGTGKEETLIVRPQKASPDSKYFISLGVSASPNLRGPKQPVEDSDPALSVPGRTDLRPGDVITKVNDQPVQQGDPAKGTSGDYYVLDRALQQSTPDRPVVLTVKRADGKEETVRVRPHLEDNFGDAESRYTHPVAFAGMHPRMGTTRVASDKSPVYKQMQSSDAIAQVIVHTAPGDAGETRSHLSIKQFVDLMQSVGKKGQTVDLIVERGDKTLPPIKGIKLIEVDKDKFGIGVSASFDEDHAVVAEVTPESAADKAKIPAGARIVSIDAKPARNWFEVRSLLQSAGKHAVRYIPPQDGAETEKTIDIDAPTLAALQNVRYDHFLPMDELIRIRQTSNPATALSWGVVETRDLILQFYVTIRRMISHDVSPSNLMGPIGIVGAGAKFAFKGKDWLVWFLAMISANLAVVNFLPIPIVDGGLFLFLIIEKIQGRPLSRKAQEYAQLVGLALILSVFLMVTYNDITRMLGH
jgi:regulator of sigma E protease